MFTYALNDDITLELQSPQHVTPLFRLIEANRAYIGAYLAWAKRVHSEKAMMRYLQRDLFGMARGERYAWVIHYRGEAVGRIGIWVNDRANQSCELYYWLIESATGYGIMTRCVRAVMHVAFDELKLNKVNIGCADDNQRSQRVAERLGFVYEATLRDNEYREGVWHDLKLYSMLKSQWAMQLAPRFALNAGDDTTLQLQLPHHAGDNYALSLEHREELAQWFAWIHDDYNLEREQAHTAYMLRQYAKRRGLFCGIFHEGQRAGNISLRLAADHVGQVSYMLNREFRGRGIMTRALHAILRYAFTVYELEKVSLRAAVNNTASQNVAKRVSMTQEVIRRDEQQLQGEFVSHVQYSMLRDDYAELSVPDTR